MFSTGYILVETSVNKTSCQMIGLKIEETKSPIPCMISSNNTLSDFNFFIGQNPLRGGQLTEMCSSTQENHNAVIKAFNIGLFEEFDMDRALWLHAIGVFAELHCLFSPKSSIAIGEPSCRPEFVESDSALLDSRS
jgi:hypothetical protein